MIAKEAVLSLPVNALVWFRRCLAVPTHALLGSMLISAGIVQAAVPVEESQSGGSEAAQFEAEGSAPSNAYRIDRFNTIEPAPLEDGYDDQLWSSNKPLVAGSAEQISAGGFESVDLQEGSLAKMFNQMQLLQREVQMLRGTLEEQQYLTGKLQRQQKEQYVDLDGRVAALAANRPAPAPGDRNQDAPSSNKLPIAREGQGWESEREAYSAAIDLMRSKEFDDSISGFEGLIVNFPNGKYTPNAFYWLGELYLAQSKGEKARQNFIQVVRLYPEHQKVPGALYKLGVLYHGLGDDKQARDYLEKVQADYPQNPAAQLASKYVQAMN
jgi:tol-pal system protein YbgF